MIFCNLKVLLAQRNISISKMSEDTQISRTTLTALCSNKSGGIQFDTLNMICSYLNVLPHEVILFSPYSIDFSIDPLNHIVQIQVKNLTNNKYFAFDCIIEKDNENIYLNNFIEDDTKYNEFKSILSSLPKYYISDLNNKIKQLLSRHFCDYNVADFNIETNLY